MDYDTAIKWLYDLQYFGMKLGLDNTRTLLKELGDPHEKLKVIHVAGTNGKGSVCALLTSILCAAGYKVGTYTSPHLRHFGERISVEGYPMTKEQVTRGIHRIKPIVERLADKDVKCTFFETTTGMALDHFARRRVDVAILEVGMGGRLDSTNVVDPAVSVITNIGLEHTQHLGRTIMEIASEKAGIVKKGRPTVCGRMDLDALKVIEAKCREMKSPLTLAVEKVIFQDAASDIFGTDMNFSTGDNKTIECRVNLAGRHQIDNVATAIAAIEVLRGQGFNVDDESLIRGLEKARWDGRLQVVRTKPLVFLDTSHNPPGAETLAAFIEEHLSGRRVITVLGMLEDKDHASYLSVLKPFIDELIFTEPDYHRKMDANKVREGAGRGKVIKEPGKAVSAALEMAGDDDVVLITGSIFTASDALAYLDGKKVDEVMRILPELYPVGAFPGREVGENETTLGKRMGDAFNVLISTILSQRTRDENTHVASEALFEVFNTPEKLAEADIGRVEELVRPAGFYKNKAKMITDVAKVLVEKHGSAVPDDLDTLLKLPGVGRKTANCVLVYGYNIPAMPVDTHVHRISNLLGLVKTREPEHSEFDLIEAIPKDYWLDINRLMVRHGQRICRPINPQCGKCPLSHVCDFGIYRLRVQ